MEQGNRLDKDLNPVHFDIDEVLIIKGLYFKVSLVDAFTGKIGLKHISGEEARHLDAQSHDAAKT